jgi:DNA-binding MarR family transcriptional regulator
VGAVDDAVEATLAALEALERRAFAYFVERRLTRPRRAPTRLQLYVLSRVREAGGASLGDLGAILDVGPAAASQLAAALVARGWLERSPDPVDRRRRLFTITAQGERLERAMRRRHRLVLRRVIGQLTALERAQLRAMAERLLRAGPAGNGAPSRSRRRRVEERPCQGVQGGAARAGA